MERALITLTSSESKRLIGRAISNLSEVKEACENGVVFIATSTSTAYLAEELLDSSLDDKGFFTAGVIVPRGICATSPERRHRYIGIKGGEATEVTLSEFRDEWLPEMGPNDVFVKGVNAIDSKGMAAILLGDPQGGTIGTAIGSISARGIQLILAAGIEKFLPGSLIDIAPMVGGHFKYSAGLPSGMILVKGRIVTEVEAFKILTKADVTPIAGGGINGAEGSHTFLIRGTSESVKRAWELFKSVKGEPPLYTVTMDCDRCQRGCSYNEDLELINLRRTRGTLGGY